MIEFKNLKQEEPYLLFKKKYEEAFIKEQSNIEAISISSFDKEKQEVESRFVNLKIIDRDKFIFFTNYNSPKSIAFKYHNQISGLFFWQSTNVQIRIKAHIKKTSTDFNQEYFKKRSPEKNALAISSVQSSKIASYKDVMKNYDQSYSTMNLSICPEYWGGFEFTPYYFEFWHGHKSRINERIVFKKESNGWKNFIIQP